MHKHGGHGNAFRALMGYAKLATEPLAKTVLCHTCFDSLVVSTLERCAFYRLLAANLGLDSKCDATTCLQVAKAF